MRFCKNVTSKLRPTVSLITSLRTKHWQGDAGASSLPMLQTVDGVFERLVETVAKVVRG